MTPMQLNYMSPTTPTLRRRWPWHLLIAAVVLMLFIFFVPSIKAKTVIRSIDPITGSMTWKTHGLFGIIKNSHVDVSPLETRLKSSGIAWTPTWQLMGATEYNIFGRPILYACGRSPPIYHVKVVLKDYAAVATDNELREFVRVMQTGTSEEQMAAVDAAGERGLAAMASVCTDKTHSHYKELSAAK